MATTTHAALDGETFLPPEEVDRVLPGVSAAALATWRRRGEGPRYVQRAPKSLIWYRVADLREWAAAMTRTPGSAPEPARTAHRVPAAHAVAALGHETSAVAAPEKPKDAA